MSKPDELVGQAEEQLILQTKPETNKVQSNEQKFKKGGRREFKMIKKHIFSGAELDQNNLKTDLEIQATRPE